MRNLRECTESAPGRDLKREREDALDLFRGIGIAAAVSLFIWGGVVLVALQICQIVATVL